MSNADYPNDPHADAKITYLPCVLRSPLGSKKVTFTGSMDAPEVTVTTKECGAMKYPREMADKIYKGYKQRGWK